MNNNIFLMKLKEKCNLNNEFIGIVDDFFDKLIEFGYVSHSRAAKLSKRLFDNIDVVIQGSENQIDYKSGYYDAIKKQLYIKDPSNIESVYLRLLYVISTTSKEDKSYNVGYSSSYLSDKSGKIIHKNYGINRAIVSNLVCRILYTLPTTLSIMPTYRTYQNNFLGYKINADNDIYFLEGKLLSQLCFALDIDEENLYSNLLSDAPFKYLDKKLKKSKLHEYSKLLDNFDDISKKYSNYNKLCYFEKLLNENFISIKKHILNDDISSLQKENKKIKLAVYDALEKLQTKNPKDKEDNINDFNLEVDTGLTEKISTLEEEIIKEISTFQNMLAETIMEYENSLSSLDFAVKLKTMQNMLIIKNPKIEVTLHKTISENLIIGNEYTSNNLIEKIKYSLVNELLANQKYKKIHRSLSFNKINQATERTDRAYIALNIDNSFVELMEITDIKRSSKNINDNVNEIELKNLKHILNSDFINNYAEKVELLFTEIKKKYIRFANIPLENMFICNVEDFNLLIIIEKGNIYLFKIHFNDIKENEDIEISPCELSENYMVYGNSDEVKSSSPNLPVLVKAKESFFKKILSFFSII